MQPECLGYGAVIAVLVSLLKRLKFVANNPKAVASVLSILSVLIPIFVHGGADFKTIAYCVIAQLSASVATYEVALAPLGDPISTEKREDKAVRLQSAAIKERAKS